MPLAPGSRLVIATHNPGKLAEIGALLAPYRIETSSAAAHGLAEPAETETSFAGNAAIKAHHAAARTGLPALADDSGLLVDALDGQPGVHAADWAETGTGRDWMQAMARVQRELEALGPHAPRTARFHCALVLAWPDGHDALFEGDIHGHLVWPPRGTLGFGYDPMFVAHGHTLTFGEMDPAEKHAISHRAAAFAKLKAALRLAQA